MNRRPLGLVAAAYAAVVLWATIGPAPWRTAGNQVDGGILNPDAWTAQVTWTTGYFSEIALNVAIFVPIGVLAALLLPRQRWPLALLIGFGFTAFIELVQLPELDRISDPRDLVANTVGSVLGALLVLVARGVRRAGLVAEELRAAAFAPIAEPATPVSDHDAEPTLAVPALVDGALAEPALVDAHGESTQTVHAEQAA